MLAARSPYFKALFASGTGMREENSRAAGEDIVFEEVSAHAFQGLLEYLYTHKLPEGDEWGAGLGPGKMAGVADRFQAIGLYEHCVSQFGKELKVGNLVKWLLQAHDSGPAELETAAMDYLKANALMFQREAMATVGVLQHRPDLISLTIEFMTVLATACATSAGGVGGGGAAVGGGGEGGGA